ncbi:hypothetical protein EXS57_03860 [Candidatus Kaiserbacteria bacterium]|nr:hypothetical protein [Candidatus Kaiserbacteria bacterium]
MVTLVWLIVVAAVYFVFGKRAAQWVFGILAVIIGTVLVLWAISISSGSEHEGTVNIDWSQNCGQVIYPKQNDAAMVNDYTCTYQKDHNGNILDGLCVHLGMSGSTCQVAYVYRVAPRIVGDSSSNPVLVTSSADGYSLFIPSGNSSTCEWTYEGGTARIPDGETTQAQADEYHTVKNYGYSNWTVMCTDSTNARYIGVFRD